MIKIRIANNNKNNGILNDNLTSNSSNGQDRIENPKYFDN